MALVNIRPVTHFTNPEITAPQRRRDSIISAPDEYIDDDELSGIDLSKQFTQWVDHKSSSITTSCKKLRKKTDLPIRPPAKRKSSLKDTSKTKFPKTPKTKSVSWREDLTSYQEDEELVKQNTEELLRQLIRKLVTSRSGSIRGAVKSSSNSKSKSSTSKRLPPPQVKPLLSPPTAQTPLLHRCQPDFIPNSPRLAYRTGSYGLITDNSEFYTLNASVESISKPLGVTICKHCGLAFKFVGACWVNLRKRLEAVPAALQHREAFCAEAFLYEDENSFAENVRAPFNSDIWIERANQGTISIDIDPSNLHLLKSDHKLWSHVDERGLTIVPSKLSRLHESGDFENFHLRDWAANYLRES